MPESLQHKLDRIRPPRVQITYDVETAGAMKKTELPFVVGVLADLSGDNRPAVSVKDRQFVEIDRDNIDDVLKSIGPALSFGVENKLSPSATTIKVDLVFKNVDDFGPFRVVQQVEPLRKLYEARQRLADLLAKLDGNEMLNDVLAQAATDKEGLQKIKGALGEGGAQ